MRHATCAAVLFLRVTEGLSVLGGETEKERKGRKNIYIYVSRRLPGRRAVAHVARSKIYREHFAWSSEFDSERNFAHHETPPLLPLLLLLGGRYEVEEGWERATVINHATGMIRLNCCSHVSALETAPRSSFASCAVDRALAPQGGGAEGRVPRKSFVPTPTPLREEAMSVTRAQPRTRPSGHWSIDFARGGLLRGDYASPSCRFPEEGRVHAEAEPEAGGRGGASAATIGARDRDAVASRGDHATGRGDRESAASAPSLLASSRSLSSPSIAISTGSVTSILLSIQILSFLRRFVSASFSNDNSIGDVFFFQPGRGSVRTPRRIVLPPPLKERLLSRVNFFRAYAERFCRKKYTISSFVIPDHSNRSISK